MKKDNASNTEKAETRVGRSGTGAQKIDMDKIRLDCIKARINPLSVFGIIFGVLFSLFMLCVPVSAPTETDIVKTRMVSCLLPLFLLLISIVSVLYETLKISGFFRNGKVFVVTSRLSEKKKTAESDGTGEGTYYTFELWIKDLPGAACNTSRVVYNKVIKDEKYHFVCVEKKSRVEILFAYDASEYEIVTQSPKNAGRPNEP